MFQCKSLTVLIFQNLKPSASQQSRTETLKSLEIITPPSSHCLGFDFLVHIRWVQNCVTISTECTQLLIKRRKKTLQWIWCFFSLSCIFISNELNILLCGSGCWQLQLQWCCKTSKLGKTKPGGVFRKQCHNKIRKTRHVNIKTIIQTLMVRITRQRMAGRFKKASTWFIHSISALNMHHSSIRLGPNKGGRMEMWSKRPTVRNSLEWSGGFIWVAESY